MIIIGITGTLGAGKGEVVEYLKEKYGFAHYSARTFLAEEIKKRDLDLNRDTLTEVANDLRTKYGPGYIIGELYNMASTFQKNSVIESVRTAGEIEILKQKGEFYLFAVDADVQIRYERIINRGSATDNITFEKFREDEFREMNSEDPNKQNLKYCMDHSEYIFTNNGTLEELHTEIDKVMVDLLKNEN